MSVFLKIWFAGESFKLKTPGEKNARRLGIHAWRKEVFSHFEHLAGHRKCVEQSTALARRNCASSLQYFIHSGLDTYIGKKNNNYNEEMALR